MSVPASYAVQPGKADCVKHSMAHVIASRPCYDIYMGGCVAHISHPDCYNVRTTFAGKPDCWIRTVTIPSVGSVLVMRARDTKQFYTARVTGEPIEKIVPCSADNLPWDWDQRTSKHQWESLAAWGATVAAGLPVEDYILSIPVDGWTLIAKPTEGQLNSYGQLQRRTIAKLRTPWPEPEAPPAIHVEEHEDPALAEEPEAYKDAQIAALHEEVERLRARVSDLESIANAALIVLRQAATI